MNELRPDDLAYLSRTARPPRTIATASWRNSSGYAGRVLGMTDTVLSGLAHASLQVSVKAGEDQTDERLLRLVPSSWYKVEVKGISDAYLEVFGSLTYVTIEDGKARLTDDPDEGDLVYLVGRIPLESISQIDWSPDPAYWRPRLYVRYRWSGPFREVAVFEKRDRYLFELHDLKFKRPRRCYLRELRMELQRRRELRRED